MHPLAGDWSKYPKYPKDDIWSDYNFKNSNCYLSFFLICIGMLIDILSSLIVNVMDGNMGPI